MYDNADKNDPFLTEQKALQVVLGEEICKIVAE